MKESVEKNNRSIANMLSITKIAIIIFIMVILFIHVSKYWGKINIAYNGQFNQYTASFFLIITVLSYFLWRLMNKNIVQYTNVFKLRWIVENIVFTIIISLPIYIFAEYENEYKYLFLLLIISCTIQYGAKYGTITSLFSAVVVLGTDLLYAPLENGVNMYFQKDIIMTGVFIVVGWVLGYYVDIEAINNKRKDDKLNKMNIELKEKNKQRREMQSILLNNEICYDILFENSLNAIIVHKDGIIIYANESAVKLLGYENSINIENRVFYNHYSKDNHFDIEKKYLNISSRRILKNIEEEQIVNYSGEVIPVRNTSSFFIYKEEATILTFLVDITSEKKVESLTLNIERKIKMLNESKEFNDIIRKFFTNMSHELKTPVNVIYSAVQTINLDKFKDEDEKKFQSYLKVMKQNCLRMMKLINNFIDITKLESGTMKLNKRNSDIVEVVEGIVQSVANYIKSSDVEIVFDTNVEEKVMGFDEDNIRRILLNLISNSIKFSNKKIYVCLIDKVDSVVIKVKDNGKGIPKDKLDIIFECFGKANYSLSRQGEGSGIGLYLVKSFVELYNGKIDIISNEGQGSEITIELPAEITKDIDYVEKILCETNEEKIAREFSDIYTI